MDESSISLLFIFGKRKSYTNVPELHTQIVNRIRILHSFKFGVIEV